jgi:hypothetical protein
MGREKERTNPSIIKSIKKDDDVLVTRVSKEK